MSKCSVLSTLKLKSRYWTLLRPKYWAWSGELRRPASATTSPSRLKNPDLSVIHVPPRENAERRDGLAVTQDTGSGTGRAAKSPPRPRILWFDLLEIAFEVQPRTYDVK